MRSTQPTPSQYYLPVSHNAAWTVTLLKYIIAHILEFPIVPLSCTILITLYIAAYIFTIYTSLIHNQRMYQSHLQTVCSLLSQYTLRILLNPKFHYRIHKSPPLVPSLSQINPLHAVPSQSFKVHFNIILPPNLRSTKWCISFRFPHQNIVCISLTPCVLHDPLILLMCWGAGYISRSPSSAQHLDCTSLVLFLFSTSPSLSLSPALCHCLTRTLWQKTALV